MAHDGLSRTEFTDMPAASQDIIWPVKTCEMHNHHLNSTVWNDFKFRDDDAVIGSYAKSGTTWMQQIGKLTWYPLLDEES